MGCGDLQGEGGEGLEGEGGFWRGVPQGYLTANWGLKVVAFGSLFITDVPDTTEGMFYCHMPVGCSLSLCDQIHYVSRIAFN